MSLTNAPYPPPPTDPRVFPNSLYRNILAVDLVTKTRNTYGFVKPHIFLPLFTPLSAMEPEQVYIYHLLNLTLHLGPNVRRVVYSSTPCSIRPSLWLTKNIEWMIQNNTGNKTCTMERPPLLTDYLCLTAGW